MSARGQQDAGGQYELVLRYLRELMCAVCGGRGHCATRRCAACRGTGFRDGNVHLLVSSLQIRR